jgi:hypothetical protein
MLSLKYKLSMLNLSITHTKSTLLDIDYYSIYDPHNQRTNWVKVVSIDHMSRYLNDDLRSQLARYEHERWNNFMIMEGFIPMTIDQFKTHMIEKSSLISRDLVHKRHICLTTFEGLIMIAQEINHFNQENNKNHDIDYIIYDYEMMDHLPEILKNSNYHIEKRMF